MEPSREKSSWTWKVFRQEVLVVEVELHPYVVQLRTTFGTSHSHTTMRTNALFTVRMPWEQGVETGVAEVGLPPKKPGIYEADYEDSVRVANKFVCFAAHDQAKGSGCPVSLTCLENGKCKEQRSFKNASPSNEGDPFAEIHERFFPKIRMRTAFNLTFQSLLHSLDRCLMEEGAIAFPTCAGIEVALLDSWSRIMNVPLHQAICPLAKLPRRVSFYTVAMNDNVAEMVASALFGLQHTPFLKIKLGPCLDTNIQVLTILYRELEARNYGTEDKSWSIDANACLNPEQALLLLQYMPAHILRALYMIEQPFPHNLTREGREPTSQIDWDGNPARWALVKRAWERQGVLVFADESVRWAEDIPPLVPICSGVNLKLEKAGGLRGLVRAAEAACAYGLRVWIGCMVGSSLNSTISAHALCLSDTACDLDGSLLVHPDGERYCGGFQWSRPEDRRTEIDMSTPKAILEGSYGYVHLSPAAGTGMTPVSSP